MCTRVNNLRDHVVNVWCSRRHADRKHPSLRTSIRPAEPDEDGIQTLTLDLISDRGHPTTVPQLIFPRLRNGSRCQARNTQTGNTCLQLAQSGQDRLPVNPLNLAECRQSCAVIGYCRARTTHHSWYEIVNCCNTEQLHTINDFTFQDLYYFYHPGVSISLKGDRRSIHA